MANAQEVIENIFVGFFLTVICILGIIGNIITFLVLLHQQRKNRNISINYFLIGLSICDTLFLFTWLNVGITYAHRLFGGELPTQSFSNVSSAYFSLIIRPLGYIGKLQHCNYVSKTFKFVRTLILTNILTYFFQDKPEAHFSRSPLLQTGFLLYAIHYLRNAIGLKIQLDISLSPFSLHRLFLQLLSGLDWKLIRLTMEMDMLSKTMNSDNPLDLQHITFGCTLQSIQLFHSQFLQCSMHLFLRR